MWRVQTDEYLRAGQRFETRQLAVEGPVVGRQDVVDQVAEWRFSPVVFHGSSPSAFADRDSAPVLTVPASAVPLDHR